MKLMEPFLDALLLDIRATAAETRRAGLRPVALYMGGGTPTTPRSCVIKTMVYPNSFCKSLISLII